MVWNPHLIDRKRKKEICISGLFKKKEGEVGMERGEVRNHQQPQQRGVGCRTHLEPDLLLQWGNRKRLRCVKIQVKDEATEKTTVRVDRRVVRPDNVPNTNPLPPRPLPHHRVLRNSDGSGCGAMKGQINGVHTSSPEERGGEAGKGNGASVSSETVQDKKGGGSSSGSDAPVWPKVTIALTNKEKEEDFMVFKGSRLPQRPKKRAKFIQRTLNLVSPGAWLCDLTLDRYEVREKKIIKKFPRAASIGCSWSIK
ncbi:uncharacterized protein LOC131217553 isoform X2 [Magnolia sinica]|uniref:uncharacterized protein LOC131217553 isoform X2 n=1 Tax=Magnolia sinica TaxID=86752 RepID=UPI00265B46C2|nr:uncharacterized protein LOC131217553 isoform X2 [Magnolia sinica]